MSYNGAKSIGNFGENHVCEFLERHGYEIVKRNFTIRGGEIDIIAMKRNLVAFVEVKTRRPDAINSGEEAITYSKRLRIIKTAEAYIEKYGQKDSAYRFDAAVVVAENDKVIKLKYYAGAFDASK